MGVRLDKQFFEHRIFAQLTTYGIFYSDLSLSVLRWVPMGTGSLVLDTYVYSSIQGTLESIKEVLQKGRINDAYALLRKYYDSTIINIYTNLYLEDNFSIENFIVHQIDNWQKGTEKIPEYRKMSEYIRNSPKLNLITSILYTDETYKQIRDRCNDHTHYNYYYNLLLNDNEIYNPNRSKALDNFSKDLENIFIQHLSYVFFLNPHYMMSSEYTDSLEIGLVPDESQQYLVARFVQDIFDQVLKISRPDIVAAIKEKTGMHLT